MRCVFFIRVQFDCFKTILREQQIQDEKNFLKGHMDIEQVSRIFHVLGTPTKKSWPGFSELPDAGKVNFQPQPPVQDWSSVGEKIYSLKATESVAHLHRAFRLEKERCLGSNPLLELVFVNVVVYICLC